MRTMEEDRSLLALSPSIPGCLESRDGSKLPSEERGLAWLVAVSQCVVSRAPLALSNGCRGRPIPLASGGRCDDTVRPSHSL